MAFNPYVVRQIIQPDWTQAAPSFTVELQLGQAGSNWDYNNDDTDGKG